MNEESLFYLAQQQPDAAARAAFLEEACADQPELRARLEKLLQAHDQPLSLLDEPVISRDATLEPAARSESGGGEDASFTFAPPAERPGTRIGPYKLLQKIGEGGMGIVWMAEQEQPVRRKVALKIIKPGMDSQQVIARFEVERQALALMDHLNIARVLDVGATDSGRPFFVMELIHGTPITKYCDDNQFTPRERLELFVPVCQAIQHAHQKGIIHRDVKPSNLLVTLYDGKPVPKVIDFGVAKAVEQRLTERTLFTQYGHIIGTFEYMSPEQAEMSALGVDTRSDIYSLGVLLYELLTGTTPLERQRLRTASYQEILRLIREEEAPKPSTRLNHSETLPTVAAARNMEPVKLTRLVRGELDWIVMKALEKERDRRYESASAFATDVQRYLNDEPVLACPPSAWYRFRKFGRRNKGPLLVATLVLLALIGGIVGTTWGMLRAEAAQRAEAERAAGERQAKQQALERQAETEAVLKFVENKVFAAARPKEQAGGLGYDVKLADAVKAALPFVDKGFADQPLVQARLRMTMGSSFQYLGDAKTASEQFQAARKLYTDHLGPDHLDTFASMGNLATSYYEAGRIQEALKLFEKTLQLRKAKLGPDHPSTLGCMVDLALSFGRLGRHADAIKLYEEALAILKAKMPNHTITLNCMNNLALSYGGVGRIQEALQLNEETLQLRKVKLGPDHPDTLKNMGNLARSYNRVGRTQEALQLFEEALQLMQAKLGPDHPDTLKNMGSLALTYRRVGRIQEALQLFEEALQLMQAKLGPDHPDTLLTMVILAPVYSDLGRYADAIKLCEQALPLMKAKTPNHPNIYTIMCYLPGFYFYAGRTSEALKLLEELKQRAGDKPGQLYDAACAYAVCARAAKHAKGPAAGASCPEKFAEEAMALLKQAVAKGYKNAAHMKQDKDLDGLRQRADFRKLLAEVQEAKKD